MNANNKSQDIAFRLILSAQNRGSLGKSTFFSAFGQYLLQKAVPWVGFDLDPDHRSFSRSMPDQVRLEPLGEEPEGDALKLFRRATETAVTVIDPRAHLGSILLRTLELVQFPEQFAAHGGRITLVLFPADDLEVLTDIDSLATALGKQVDYLIVKNRARAPRTRMFDNSALEADLEALGAAELEMPILLTWARNHVAALEAELGRGLTQLEVASNRDLPLDPMVRLVAEEWIRSMFRRFDRVSAHLLPSSYSSEVKSVDAPASMSASVRRGAKINRQNL